MGLRRMALMYFSALTIALGAASEMPRYVFVNNAPGTEWNAGNPEN